MGGACSTRGDKKYVHNFYGKPERKKRLKRLGRRLGDNIKMDLKEIRFFFSGFTALLV
jgi:hypothetical protein